MTTVLRKGLPAGCVLVLVLGVMFAWGFLAHRNRIFPYSLLRRLEASMPAGKEAHTERELVESTSVSADLERLEALGYVDATYDKDHARVGVLQYDASRVFPGLNLYCSRTENRARLIDMEGHEVHSWSYPGQNWQHVDLLPRGDLLVIIKNSALLRLDRHSNLLWSFEARVHHDTWVDADRILVLTRKNRIDPDIHPSRALVEDFVTILDESGVELEDFSVLQAVRRSPYAFLLPAVQPDEFPVDGPPLDLLHTNHIEVLDGRHARLSPMYAKGNLLLSCRNINTVMILDGQSHDVVWVWGPSNLTFQHHPSMLDNGHILMFDNGRQKSRVIEVDPLSESIVWKYSADGFFSVSRGSAQRLANGNTLITESDPGTVFEVTPEGRVVWLFANPDVSKAGERSAIWRMTRIGPDELDFDPLRE